VLDGVVCILKAVIFKSYSAGSSLADTRLTDSVLPLLINLLDERDGTARAVVMLIAEYCSVYSFHSFHLLILCAATNSLSLGLKPHLH
jgi:hypothetical protein